MTISRPSTISLDGSPYLLEKSGLWFVEEVGTLHERTELLREQGRLSDQTLRAYFGDKRFEQIAESNAIEGSTLSVGETELAIEKGITLTGHNPEYFADAVNLSKALEHMVHLARDRSATDIAQVKELHSLILGRIPTAGRFRLAPVRISGSDHVPAGTWYQIVEEMEDWERWSKQNDRAPALLRAIVLPTWLVHIHPFSDGNGRTSRAVMNLELIRAGLPSVIIRHKDRVRYYEALAESDLGGDLGPIAELILRRAEDALRDLERAAKAFQGYNLAQAKLRKAQQFRVAIWNDAVRLLFSLLRDAVDAAVGESGTMTVRWYEGELSLDDFAALSQRDSAGNSWLFRMDVNVPGLDSQRYLAWTGYRSFQVKHGHGQGIGDGPSIFWSVADPSGYRHWVKDDSRSPGVAELTLELPNVDRWIARMPHGDVRSLQPSSIARTVADAIVESLSTGS